VSGNSGTAGQQEGVPREELLIPSAARDLLLMFPEQVGQVLRCAQDEEPFFPFTVYRSPFTPLLSFGDDVLGRDPAAQHSSGRIHPEMVLHAADVQSQGVSAQP
jgi:hypothetical protein